MGKRYNVSAGEILAIIIVIVVLLIIAPFISYWLAHFGGWLAKITIGATLCDALNTLFGTMRFQPDMLPQMAGALGWIGSFFKGVKIIKEKH